MPGTIEMTVGLSVGDVRARLAQAIDQSALARFIGLHLRRARFIGKVDASEFRFTQTMHLFWAKPGPVCEGSFGPHEGGTRILARVRRHWIWRANVLLVVLVFLPALWFVAADLGSRGMGWELPACFSVAIIAALVFWWASDAAQEMKMRRFLFDLFADSAVSQREEGTNSVGLHGEASQTRNGPGMKTSAWTVQTIAGVAFFAIVVCLVSWVFLLGAGLRGEGRSRLAELETLSSDQAKSVEVYDRYGERLLFTTSDESKLSDFVAAAKRMSDWWPNHPSFVRQLYVVLSLKDGRRYEFQVCFMHTGDPIVYVDGVRKQGNTTYYLYEKKSEALARWLSNQPIGS